MIRLKNQILRAALVFLSTWNIPFASAVTAKDRFDVSYVANTPGTCAALGESNLNQFLADCISLAQSGVDAINAYAAGSGGSNDLDRIAISNVLAFFHLNDPSNTNPNKVTPGSLKGYLNQILAWLKNGGPVSAGTQTSTPPLYCSESYAIRQAMSDQMMDANGKPATTGNGKPLLIKDVPSMVKGQQAADQLKQAPTFPYYFPISKAYQFDISYGPSPTDGECHADPDTQGYTVQGNGKLPTFIVLCPRYFSNTKSLAEIPSMVTPIPESSFLPPTTTIAEPHTTFTPLVVPRRAQDLEEEVLQPGGAILFHELFHMYYETYSGDETHADHTGEEYDLYKILGAEEREKENLPDAYITAKESADNPENWVYFCLSYWLSQNTQCPAPNQVPVEFFAAWAVCS